MTYFRLGRGGGRWLAGCTAIVVVGLAAVIAGGSDSGGRGTASCKGAIQGDGFNFSCDAPIGGNPQGSLFLMSSPALASLSVSSPAGITCKGREDRFLCEGPAVPAGRAISGTFTTRTLEGEEGELEEEGEKVCSGTRITVIAFGNESSEEEGEGGGEGASAVPIARAVIDSCGAPGEGEPGIAVKLGHPTLNTKRGTALLPVTVSTAGEIVLSGKSVAKVATTAAHGGTYGLLLRARGGARKQLERQGHVSVKAQVSFTAGRSKPVVRHTTVRLRLGRS